MDPQHPMDGEFPEIDGPPEPEHKMETIQHAVGKTIGALEFGRTAQREGVHDAEALVLHFTDGTALSIGVGSNAWNLSGEHTNLTLEDFSTDLMPFWKNRPRPHDRLA